MKHNKLRLAALALATAIGIAPVLAVPAAPWPIEIEQPDGSKVTLSLRGDEYFHYYQTTDGHITTPDADGWYRIVDNDGNITDMPAMNAADRSDAYNARLATINAQSAFTRLREKAEAQAVARNAYRSARLAPTRAAKAGETTKWNNSDGHYLRTFPCEGEQNVLIILVSFADKDWSFCDDPHTEMQNMLQQPGYDKFQCTGSAFDYFKESSRGLFLPSFDVYGPVQLPQRMSYYGGNNGYGDDMRPDKMVTDACNILDDKIDFKKYDRDGDGVVDNIYIFYAGYGENEGRDPDAVWPHSWDIRYADSTNPVKHDGVIIGHYACSNELTHSGDIMTGIGTFCHEFSHVLGLPDLYPTSYTNSHTPGDYSLMDQGSYNNNGRTPPVYSAYERYALEWQKPLEITKGEEIAMRALSDGGCTYKMTVDASQPTQYFLFENRQPIGNDVTLPGHGMLVWRIDYKEQKWANNTVNNTPTDQCVDIIEADNSASDSDMNGDTFPGIEHVTEFTATSTPAFANKNGKKSALGLTQISQSPDGIISFKVGDGMNEDSDYPVTTPGVVPESISTNSFTIDFTDDNGASASYGKSNGNDGTLIVSVEESAFDDELEAFVTTPLENYTLLRVPSDEPLTVSGLKPLSSYRVKAYRETTGNISRPCEISITTAAESLAESRPQMRLDNARGNDASISWTAVEGADHYLLTVATRDQKPSSDNMTANFSGTPKLPSGWDAIGAYATTEGNYGQASPSFYMSEPDDYLWTEYFDDKEIESVELWCRKADNSAVGLDIYTANKNGAINYAGPIEALTTDGGTAKLSLPENTHSIVFLLSNATGSRVYIDDIKLNFRGEYTDTPVGLYADMPVNDTKATVNGLEVLTDYVAYVKVHDGEKAGIRSNSLAFTTTDESGIEETDADSTFAGLYCADGVIRCADADATFSVYGIDGTVIAKEAKGSCQLPSRGIYIVRIVGRSLKVLY